MMRSWKTAIEALGFRRWRYVKLDHLHCMAFRKLPPASGQHPGITNTPQHQAPRHQDSPITGTPQHPAPRDPPITSTPQHQAPRHQDPPITSTPQHPAPKDPPVISTPQHLVPHQDPPSGGLGVADLWASLVLDGGDCVAAFPDMLYIPQDFSGTDEEEGGEAVRREEFRGEEERLEFFSTAGSELPGCLCEED